MFRTITYSSALGLCLLAMSVTGCDLGEFTGEIVPNPVVEPPPNAPEPAASCGAGCHGGPDTPSPPLDTNGLDDPSLPTVGAHRAHLRIAPVWYKQIECTECHTVPANVGDPGHLDQPDDGSPADVIFGPIARGDNVQAEYNGTCGVYCHGVSMQGGDVTQPGWTQVGALTGCSSCHAYPPPPPHPAADDCGGCHTAVEPGTDNFLVPETHINGIVETAVDGNGDPGEPAQACDGCHGGNGISAPPAPLEGGDDYTNPGVGAHRAHLEPADWRKDITCVNCHTVPLNVDDPGHLDGDNNAEVIFDALNPQANYDFGNNTCTNMYCHGAGYNQNAIESWVEQKELGCTGCHDDGTNGGVNMSGAHDDHLVLGQGCNTCHGQVMNAGGNFVDADLHINGYHEVTPGAGTWDANAQFCANVGCHGDRPWDNQ